MRKLLFSLLFLCASFYSVKAQINFDFTDSLANQQKQYIIRFDVANGNIYLPVKKKTKINFSELSLFNKDVIRLKDEIIVPLYKDTVMNGKVVKWKYSFQKIDNPAIKNSKNQSNLVRYFIAGRYFKPSVGTFIRLVFDNVPKNMDIGVEADFLDKNLENAPTFEGFLNKYATALDTSVNRDVKSQIQEKKVEEIKKQVQDSTQVLKDSLEGFKKNVDSTMKKIESIKNTLGTFKLSSNPANDSSKKTPKFDPTIDSIVTGLKKINIDSSNMLIIPNISLFVDSLGSQIKLLERSNTYDRKIITSLNRQLDTIRGLSTNLDSSKSHIFILFEIVKNLKKQQYAIQKNYDSVLLSVYDSIYNRRTIYIQPIQIPNNDISLLKITYKNNASPEKSIFREIMLKNKYGFKLDFSTGFIGTGLLDDSYRIVPTPNTVKDTATIISDSKGKFAIGFALMAHAYMRTGERINFAINTGLMLNSSNQTLNYLTGISIPLGLEQRFIVSGGIAYGKVKRLTSGFEPNTPYTASVLNLSSGVPYTEKWDNSWYLGVSYNLSSLTASSRRTVIAR